MQLMVEPDAAAMIEQQADALGVTATAWAASLLHSTVRDGTSFDRIVSALQATRRGHTPDDAYDPKDPSFEPDHVRQRHADDGRRLAATDKMKEADRGE